MPKGKNSNSTLKHFKFGLELEQFTLDEKGYISNDASKIIQETQGKTPAIVKGEVGKNMIELESPPNIYVPNVMQDIIETLEKSVSAAKEKNLLIFPFGTYPGSFTPAIVESKRYKIQQELFGKKRYAITARCVGLHCHYTLPKGVFNRDDKVINPLIKSKNKQSLIHIHNLFVAMDPALTTFTQSSPFYQGKYLGKDSRIIVYRGGILFDYPSGLFAQHERFGGLQKYITTNTDLLHIIGERFQEWTDILSKFGVRIKNLLKHGSVLDTTWNPVKINAHGTTEQRGMDANYPSIIVAVSLIIKYISKEVQEKFITVQPSDEGIESPFKLEGDTLIIPPDSYVITHLQVKAALEGLENEDVYQYCNALYKLAKQLVPEDRSFLMEPLARMLSERKTVSDQILEKAKDLGVNPKEGISDAKAAELALFFSNQLEEDLIQTKQALEKVKTPLPKSKLVVLLTFTGAIPWLLENIGGIGFVV